jgi:Zn finger protein HypA/HybF involved in hydrogenase expression
MRYNQLTQEEFIDQCRKKHGDEYDYSLVEYTNTTNKIKIICKTHGIFEQVADHHKRGRKCPNCGGFVKNTDTFISDSIKVHGLKYNYSLVNYINNRIPVIIICEKHGEFEQIPKHHLTGSGCPICNKSKGEVVIINLLKELNIKYKRQKTFDGCKDKKELQFDFYLYKYNMCVEYDGIQHFKVIERFGGVEGFERRLFLDNIKTQYCLDNNIALIRIRYDENILDKLSFLVHI